jgi:hypothetical protein
MGEQREIPSSRFFFVEDEMNDLAQFWMSVLIIAPQLLFQLRERGHDFLGETCWLVSDLIHSRIWQGI